MVWVDGGGGFVMLVVVRCDLVCYLGDFGLDGIVCGCLCLG